MKFRHLKKNHKNQINFFMKKIFSQNLFYLALIVCLMTTTIFPAVAQEEEEAPEEEKSFTISGSVDTYFHTSFGSEDDAPASSFANNKGFALGMANLIASYSGDKYGFTADLVFGPRGRAAVFNSEQGIINQMFAYLKLGESVTLNLGQFNTFVGYEVISPTLNFHYSTSYMFSYGPFSHTGLRADFDFGEGWGAKLAVMNPTDLVEFNPVSTYVAGGQLGFSNDNGGAWLNFLYGDHDGKLDEMDPAVMTSDGGLFQVDLTTGWSLSDAFYVGLNTTYRTIATGEMRVGDDIQDADGDAKGFYGVALYPKVTFSDALAAGVRFEYFGEFNSGAGALVTDGEGDGSIIDVTLSLNYTVGKLRIIPEFRIDSASEDSFDKKDFDGMKKSLSTFSLAAVYAF